MKNQEQTFPPKQDAFPRGLEERLIRLPEVTNRVGFQKSTIWARIKDGTFPKPYKLGARISAWKLSEINTWIEEQVVSL